MSHRRKSQRRPARFVIAAVALLVAAAVAVAVGRHQDQKDVAARGPMPVHLPLGTESYVGVYNTRSPGSFDGVTDFSRNTGVTPDLAMYYSSWYEPFRSTFARTAASHGAVPVVQMEPSGVKIASIATGKYDAYLSAFASSVAAYKGPVILSFGHEMNGSWYTWANTHTAPAAFVAAWRHIVTLFRNFGAKNVTWLWTVNIINKQKDNFIPAPAAWWPGSKYVTWVGIDGYYLKSPWTFAPLFGPTIAAVKQLTHDPILISETGAAPEANKAAKIANLFEGIRAYGLLGFVWFDAVGVKDWRLTTAAEYTAFRQAAKSYKSPVS
jgi:mannan endo-1,4-beta-mannosidase